MHIIRVIFKGMNEKTMINIRSSREIEQLRKANAIVAEVFERLRSEVTPGVTTRELDQIAEEVIRSEGAVPAFQGLPGLSRKPLCLHQRAGRPWDS